MRVDANGNRRSEGDFVRCVLGGTSMPEWRVCVRAIVAGRAGVSTAGGCRWFATGSSGMQHAHFELGGNLARGLPPHSSQRLVYISYHHIQGAIECRIVSWVPRRTPK